MSVLILVPGNTWIGARSKITGLQIYRWLNFEQGSSCPSFVYTNWNAGEPNNSHGGEDCALMYTNGYWNDGNCAAALQFVCEAPLYNGGCPTGMIEFGTSCYAKVSSGKVFGDAQAYCVNSYPGGNLVSISDANENNQVKSMITGNRVIRCQPLTTCA